VFVNNFRFNSNMNDVLVNVLGGFAD